jgi:branched-chain amino acid transport system substrate-binding protein
MGTGDRRVQANGRGDRPVARTAIKGYGRPCGNKKYKGDNLMTLRTKIRWCLSWLAGAVFASAAHAADPYIIHYLGSLSGGAAFLGQGEKISFELAQKAINDSGGIQGRPVQFIYHDDQTNPQVAVQLATEIFASKPKPALLMGPSLSAPCRAVASLTKRGPFLFCLSPYGNTDKGSFNFTLNLSGDAVNTALLRYFRLKGWTRVAALFSTDATGQATEAGVKRAMALPENSTLQMVALEHFNNNDVSVAAQIERIKAGNPQAIMVWTTGAQIATVFRALAQANLDVPIGTGDGMMTYTQMAQYKGFVPKQLYIPTSQWVVRDASILDPAVAAKNKEFYKYFEAAGVRPDLPTSHGWEAAMLIVDALRKFGPDATAEQLRDYFAGARNLAGIYGVYDFVGKEPQRGLDVNDAIITVWDAQADTWKPVSKPAGIPLQ